MPDVLASTDNGGTSSFLEGKRTFITLGVMWLAAVLGPHLKGVSGADQTALFTRVMAGVLQLITYGGPFVAAYFRAMAKPKPK